MCANHFKCKMRTCINGLSCDYVVYMGKYKFMDTIWDFHNKYVFLFYIKMIIYPLHWLFNRKWNV